MADQGKSKQRGFAAMSAKRRREIAALGGAAVPPEKRSFSVDRSLAAEAGSKGGQSVPDEARSFAIDRELARKAGRKGGIAVHQPRNRGWHES